MQGQCSTYGGNGIYPAPSPGTELHWLAIKPENKKQNCRTGCHGTDQKEEKRKRKEKKK